jgi:hypothetical protein
MFTVPFEAVIFVVPNANAVNFPFASIVPTVSLLLFQVTIIVSLNWSLAVNVCVLPTDKVTVVGIMIGVAVGAAVGAVVGVVVGAAYGYA